jgi:hypothetical protein
MQTAICRGLDDSPQAQDFLSGVALGLHHQAPEDIEEPFQQTETFRFLDRAIDPNHPTKVHNPHSRRIFPPCRTYSKRKISILCSPRMSELRL